VKLVCPYPFAVERDRLPHPGGSFVAVGSEVLSSWRMAAPDQCFPCLRRSGSGRFSFSDSSASWRARGVDFCGDSNVWSCSSVVAGGSRSGLNVRHLFGLVPRCGGRRRSLVLVDPVEDVCVIGLVCRGLFKKGYVLYPQMIYKSFFDCNKKEMEGVHFLILVLHVHNLWQEGYRDF
jgi:hypothetical protein